MTERIKLGLIGTGHMGQYHVNVATGLSSYYDVTGIYDASEQRAAEIAGRFGVRAFGSHSELMESCDAVTIAVPTVYHYQIAKEALERGKHVLVEKPMTETTDQAKELVKLADEKGLILQVGHVERFNAAVMELKKVVDKPLLVESRRLSPPSNRIGDVGVTLDLLIHDLDIITNLIGREIKSIFARGKKVYSNHEDIAVATLHFEGGAVANLTASRATQSKIRTLTISQEKAYIILDFSTQDIEIHRQASIASLTVPDELRYKQESFVEKIFIHKDNPLRQEHLHFIRCIRKEEAPMVTGNSDIRTLEIANEILRQIRENMES